MTKNQHPATEAVAQHLRLSERLLAAEQRIARLELRLSKAEAAKPAKRESATEFKRRVLAALGVKQ